MHKDQTVVVEENIRIISDLLDILSRSFWLPRMARYNEEF